MSEKPDEGMSCCSVRKKAPEEPSENSRKEQSTFGKILEFLDSVRGQVILASISAVAIILSVIPSVASAVPFHLAWIAIVLCAPERFIEAFKALRKKRLNADVLISTAIVATIITGEIFAGGEVALIMSLGHLLEEWTIGRTRAGIEKLIKMTPKTARRVQGDEEIVVSLEEIKAGETVRVLPGESIPVDGVILSGNTSVEQQLMTGEPLPVDKTVGDEVFAGTINRFGVFTMKAEKVGEDSTLAQMIRLVNEAEMQKAPMERITDRFASFLVPCAIAVAIIIGLIWWNPILAVTVLVVFCPCSLVLATPTAIVAAIGNASRYGILIRSGDVLEKLGRIKTVAFDKTGTLTQGKPILSAVVSLQEERSEEALLSLAASIEQESDHPLSRSVVEAAKERGVRIPPSGEDCRVVPGRGVVGETGSGETVLIGNEKLLKENEIIIPKNALDEAEPFLKNGATIVWVAVRSKTVGFLVLEDTVREKAGAVVKKLQDEGLDVMLLSGDNVKAVENCAKLTGIETVHAELLPQDKQRLIRERSGKENGMIAMVGDGINDAPALKTADIGIAMGKMGSDLAIEAADVVLVGDDISRVPYLIGLSRKTIRTIIGNIAFSMGINFVAVSLTAANILTDPAIGALIHNTGSLFVTLNASLLLMLKMKD